MDKNKENNRPVVGVSIVIIKDGKILIGEDARKGEALFGVPGGHWESGETLKECAIREAKEESGAVCSNMRLISVYDFYREDKKKSYVSIGMAADFQNGKLRDLPEEGRLNWDWYKPKEALKLKLFLPDRILIERYLSGIIFE